MSVFKDYSRFYDLLYKDKDYEAEAKYVNGLLRKYAPGARSILDLGCGTGRHALLLAQKGYAVHGVDRSDDMLAKAERNLSRLPRDISKQVSFSVGDIREIRLDRTFDAVSALFHVMSYQTTNDDIMAVFNTASAHIESGGVFIFDFWYGPAVLAERPETRVKRMEDDEIKVCRIAEPVVHEDENVVDVNYEVFMEDKSTNNVETVRETHRMRYLFYPEMEFMLKDAGLTVIKGLEWMTEDKGLSPRNYNGLMIAGKR